MREIFRRPENISLRKKEAAIEGLFTEYGRKIRGDEDNTPLEISGPEPVEAIKAANILLDSVEKIAAKGRPLKAVADKWEVEIIFEDKTIGDSFLYEPWTGQPTSRVKDVLQINFTHRRPVRMQYEKRCPRMEYSVHSIGGDMGIAYCGFRLPELGGRRIPDSDEARDVAKALAIFYDL